MEKFNSARRLGFQLLIVISAGLIFLASYFIISDYYKTIKLSEDDTMEQLETVAKTIALNLDGNQHDFLIREYTGKDAIKNTNDNAVYQYIHQYLRKVQLANNIETDIYTLFYDSAKKEQGLTPFYFGITSGEKPYFRHAYENYPKALEENYHIGSKIPAFTDEHGTWLSYFAPIINKDKKVVAVVQVDKKFDEFITSSRKQAMKGLLVSLVIFLAIGFLLVFIVRKIVRIDEIKSMKLESMNEKVRSQHKDITDSINYSERIQKAIVPGAELFKSVFPDSFLFYRAKDVISGDFPWVYKREDGSIYVAAVDCTGHGVPGCMLSFIGYFLLNEIVGNKDVIEPSHVLGLLNEGVVKTLKQERDKSPMDGMDVGLCRISSDRKELQFAGAHRPLYLLRNGDLTVFKGDRQPIGGSQFGGNEIEFANHIIDIQAGDAFFIFSDGLQDQFGGSAEKKKKYSSKRIREMLIANQHLPMDKLKAAFEKDFENWMGNHEQVDDVLLIGLKF